MLDVPEAQRHKPERGRLTAIGRRTDDGSRSTLDPGACSVTWFLQSMGEHDTHRGAMTRGMVVALCGIRFAPITVAYGHKALPGQPLDPDQICPDCQRVVDAQ